MPDYRPSRMSRTPWGNADQLRERMLRPGPGIPREVVAQSQRERLFAATVATVGTKGYEGMTVADLLELSGVSRSAFYQHFHDKEDCLVATFDALAAMALELADARLGPDGLGEKQARRAFREQLEMVIQQPAAAHLCFADVYTAGERGRFAVERSLTGFTEVAGGAIARIHGRGELPDQMIRGILGGAQTIIQSKLRRGDPEALPALADDLFEWALGYEPPSARLRLAGRRSRPPGSQPPPFVVYDQAERIIRALAAGAGERGYPAVTIAEIAARASVSQATFYSYFADKHAALIAALDSAGAQMLGAVMPAARRSPDWANGIRGAIGALCGFYAAEPDFARLTAVETYAAGPAALEQRERDIVAIRALLEPGFDAFPGTKPIVADAVLGAVWSLLYIQITTIGPESLPTIAPLASYMVLAPFVGSKEATRVANGDGRGPQA